jgi:DNA-binding NarL/FixJ family response regulator
MRIDYTNPAATAVMCEGEEFAENLAPEALAAWEAIEASLRSGALSEAALESAMRRGGALVAYVRWRFRRLEDSWGEFVGIGAIGHDETERYGIQLLSEQAGLTAREVAVLEYVVAGYTNLNIAALLGLSESGVKFHLRGIFAKTNVASRTELMGLILPGDALRRNLWRG